MAYFDNAATTYPKPKIVYDFMDEFYRNVGGSAGRGTHFSATSSAKLIADTRENLKRLLHCEAKEVIFTSTATIALNMIIQGMIKKGCKNIYISPFEHNAVTRVLHSYQKENLINVKELIVTKDFEYDLERIKYQFDEIQPDLVIVSHGSNVFGLISPIEEIFELSKRYDAINLLDMAQTAGLIDCNVGLNIIDFAVFNGHKTLYAPTGIAGFIMTPNIDLPPVLFGGTGYDSANQDMPSSLPERYEMGTINTLSIAGLNAALEWILNIGLEKLRAQEKKNRERLLEILEDFSFIRVVGNFKNREYTGIVSCLIDGISSESAAPIFDKYNIAVRTGLHCSPNSHKFIGTFPSGTIRFSVSYFTSEEDFNQLIDVLEYIEEGI